MGISGLLIFIIGIAMVIANNSAAKKKAQQSNGEPNNEVESEFERRIREIIGEPRANTSRSNSPQKGPVKNELTTQAPKQRDGRKNEANAAPTYKVAEPRRARATVTNRINTGVADSEKSQVEEITDDFTLEKAVIYSEIIKPKFEEY